VGLPTDADSHSQTDAVGVACRNVINRYCNPSGAGAPGSSPDPVADPACACALLEQSTVPIPVVAGQPMTYTQFVDWFQTNFKGDGVPSLIRDLACWWPPCRGQGAALHAFSPCPPDIQICLSLIQSVSATNGAKVTVQLKNACGIEPSDANPVNNLPAPNAPAGPPPLSQQLIPIIIVVCVAVVLCVVFLACTPLVASSRKRS
jgi:hypothetical protein